MTPQRPSAALAVRRQFTLAGLLSFFVGASVYVSMMASVLPLLLSREPASRAFRANLVTVPTAWLVLWLLYRRWRLRQAIIVHYAGPVMVTALFMLFGLIPWFLTRWPYVPYAGELAGDAVILLLMGCGLSAAISLPAAVLMLLYLCTRPPAQRQHSSRAGNV